MKNNKRTLFLVGLLILVAAIGIPIIKDNFGQDKEASTGPVSIEEYDKIVKLLADVQAVSIDTSILGNDTFNYLSDFSLPLPNLPLGRTNPFANY